jgi:hypothetical protein
MAVWLTDTCMAEATGCTTPRLSWQVLRTSAQHLHHKRQLGARLHQSTWHRVWTQTTAVLFMLQLTLPPPMGSVVRAFLNVCAQQAASKQAV